MELGLGLGLGVGLGLGLEIGLGLGLDPTCAKSAKCSSSCTEDGCGAGGAKHVLAVAPPTVLYRS